MRVKLLTLIFLMVTIRVSSQTKIIAHRGFWITENTDENSIKSLKNAQKLGVYGSEFDIQMTKNEVPIYHDKKIKDYIIENTNYNILKDFLLENGERLPTLEEYLE